ncbi:hypothetical protein D3C86_1568170 [compost metagenome]
MLSAGNSSPSPTRPTQAQKHSTANEVPCSSQPKPAADKAKISKPLTSSKAADCLSLSQPPTKEAAPISTPVGNSSKPARPAL